MDDFFKKGGAKSPFPKHPSGSALNAEQLKNLPKDKMTHVVNRREGLKEFLDRGKDETPLSQTQRDKLDRLRA